MVILVKTLMLDLCQVLSSPDDNWWTGVDYCEFSSSSHSDGTHSLQSIHWLSFWRHPFTAEHPLTLILTAPIHCRSHWLLILTATHHCRSIQWLSFWRHPFTCRGIHWLSFWRHPFTAEHHCPLDLNFWRHPFLQSIHWPHSDGTPFDCRASIDLSFSDGHPFTADASIDSHSDGTPFLQRIHWLLILMGTHSSADHPLTLHDLTAPIPIHCRASIAETHFSKSDVETLIYIWDGLRVNTFTFLAELFF